MKYISVAFLVGFFIIITITGLKECTKPEEEPYVLATDIIFEVFMGENYAE